jgi:hypothetical protein
LLCCGTTNQTHRNSDWRGKRESILLRQIDEHLAGVVTAGIRRGSHRRAALIATNEPFFIGLFTAATFTAGFLACCLGMGGVFAAGWTGGVNGASDTGLTAVTTGPGGATCIPMRFLFAPEATEAGKGTVPPGAAGAQPTPRDLAAASSADSAGAGRASTASEFGAAMRA